ncbi:MAG: class I SAM-dependent methyltransferase, partial [Oscillospiraceae bacterium]|nr:class I SAM-dependent methyltransferase [Oscillospiraceae bacterium]
MQHYFTHDPTMPDDLRNFAYYFGGHTLWFTSNSGTFSHGHVDPLSHLLINTMPAPQGTLLDLGCGWGAMGISLAKAHSLQTTLADVNPRALHCAELNCQANEVDCTIIQSDCLDQITGMFDTIVLNPPIHAGKEVMWRMFDGAHEHLNPGGKFYIVVLEKHGAKSTMRKLGEVFGA